MFCLSFFENKIIKKFKIKYIQRRDIGREYFEGNFEMMMDDIYIIVKSKILKTNNKHNNEIDPTLKYAEGYRNNIDPILKYINERTEEANTHIHTSVLYADFKKWFFINYPRDSIPSNRRFVAELRNHIKIQKVNIKGKNTVGTKYRRIKNDIALF